MSLMSDYREELKNKETLRLREIQRELPSFVQAFFRGIAQTTSTKTRLAYAYDLRIFFRYLYEEHRTLGGIEPKDLTAAHLSEVTSEDIDCFMEYLSYYIRPDYENPVSLPQRGCCLNICIRKKLYRRNLPLWSIPRKSTKKLLCVWM